MKKSLLSLYLIVLFFSVEAQNITITPGGITPALTGTYPRITYDAILALPSPVKGDIAFDITFDCLRVYTGTRWICTFQKTADPTPNILAIASAGGIGADLGQSIAVDVSGNVYITGSYQSTATFGATSKTAVGGLDIFIAKYNSTGTLQWVQSAGGPNYEVGYGIAVDGSGNVYVTGYCQAGALFGGLSCTSFGQNDIFLAKYNSSGTFQWVQTAGEIGDETGYAIAVDNSSNVYITGYYNGTATFGVNTTKTSAGLEDIFIAKYSSAGTLLALQTAGGTNFDEGKGIAVDASGNVYVTGYYTSTASFGIISKTATGSSDIFVGKYDQVGASWLWVQSSGGNSFDQGNAIAVDGSGNVYATGYFIGSATIGGISKTGAGGADVFVVKYNSSGTTQWVQTAGGANGDIGYGITVDATGNVYVMGNFSVLATFGNIAVTSAGSDDIFIEKYNTSGTFQWVQSGGGVNTDAGLGIALDAIGNVFITGDYFGTATFGATSLTATTADKEIFVVRLDK